LKFSVTPQHLLTESDKGIPLLEQLVAFFGSRPKNPNFKLGKNNINRLNLKIWPGSSKLWIPLTKSPILRTITLVAFGWVARAKNTVRERMRARGKSVPHMQ
jgi:hypothetical protein